MEKVRIFSYIVCEGEDCQGGVESPSVETTDCPPSMVWMQRIQDTLQPLGWTIQPGLHRCPTCTKAREVACRIARATADEGTVCFRCGKLHPDPITSLCGDCTGDDEAALETEAAQWEKEPERPACWTLEPQGVDAEARAEYFKARVAELEQRLRVVADPDGTEYGNLLVDRNETIAKLVQAQAEREALRARVEELEELEAKLERVREWAEKGITEANGGWQYACEDLCDTILNGGTE